MTPPPTIYITPDEAQLFTQERRDIGPDDVRYVPAAAEWITDLKPDNERLVLVHIRYDLSDEGSVLVGYWEHVSIKEWKWNIHGLHYIEEVVIAWMELPSTIPSPPAETNELPTPVQGDSQGGEDGS